jgi:hypothetical protein
MRRIATAGRIDTRHAGFDGRGQKRAITFQQVYCLQSGIHSTSMLDVHAPHKSVHTWADFFTHIAIITIGLLIAVGLEQSVEFIHRKHEASILLDDLHAESVQVLKDSHQAVEAERYEIGWLSNRIAQVQSAIATRHPVGPREPNNLPDFNSPDIPIWRSAKAGAKTPLLTKRDVNAYAEIEYVQARVDSYAYQAGLDTKAVRSFNREFPSLPNGDPDFSHASLQDLKNYLRLLTIVYEDKSTYILWVQLLIGAETAVLDGKTSLDEIYASEQKASHGPVVHPM